MKRRVLSLMITLALCLDLCPVLVLAADGEQRADGSEAAIQGRALSSDNSLTLGNDETVTERITVTGPYTIDTNGHTLTVTDPIAIQVANGGKLDLTGRVISSQNSTGVGVAVQSGGLLNVTGANTYIRGNTYALDIASGATVKLSAGEYIGRGNAAIRTEDGNYAALLAQGCGYFDASDAPILPENIAGMSQVVVKPCAGHSGKSYAHDSGAPTHTWTCPYCGTKESEKCTFAFDRNGQANCREQCGHSIAIAVDESALGDLIYNGTDQSAHVTLTVSLEDGTMLVKDKDYRVDYSTRADVGEITVTVTGITFYGTFTKTYQVNPDQPLLQWATDNAAMNYDGSPVEKSDLPAVNITVQSAEDLHGSLQYLYKKQTDPAYIDGLPTDAGTYDVIVRLPETQNYKAAESAPLKLTINKIAPITEAPKARTLTFDYTAQELVTSGTLDPVAVKDGLEILFAADAAGPYSTTIPTGTDAGDSYRVWYKVTGLTGNYVGPAPDPAEVPGVKIQRKTITPNITLSKSSFTYDGSKQEPAITVKDGTTGIGIDQYTVTWTGDQGQADADILRAVGKYTATIKSKDSGNYTFTATAQVEIVAAAQDGLSITGLPAHVYYGDTITTLGTSGGTGAGTVKWKLSGETNSSIGETTSILEVKDVGTLTVTAERTVPNYGTVSDSWTFNVEPKPVTAEVTVTAKDYNGDTAATVTAAVKASDLVNTGDTVNISGLTGTYDNANAGTNKTVTLNSTGAAADNADKYTVSYPATAKGDIDPRNVNVMVTLSGNDLQQEANGTYWYEYDGTDKTPAVTVTADDDNAKLAASDYSVSYANNKNFGNATVTVTAKAEGNYTFADKSVNFTIKKAEARLTRSPEVRDLTYTGADQELVTGGTASGGHVEYSLGGNAYSSSIPKASQAGNYTVRYKAVGDANHSDSAVVGTVTVTIKPKEITPTITLSGSGLVETNGVYSYAYDGTAKTPTVTVKDGTVTIGATEYSVTYRDNINAGTATVTVSDKNGGNYIVNGTAVFQITKAPATFTAAPVEKTDLRYSGAAQELVQAGGSNDGTVVYSVNGGNYSAEIPTESAVGTYTVSYKILGDANHSDTAPTSLPVNIDKNTVTAPRIWLSSDTFRYTGSQQQPEITVCDDSGRLIPENEYTKTITGVKSNNMVDVDTYTVTITTPSTSNYVITTNNTKTFEIVAADQETISITGTRGQVFYGDVIRLDTTGGTGSGTVTWKIEGHSASTLSSAGLLTVKDVSGSIKVTATRSRGGNYSDVSATWEFTPAKKPVTAVLTGVDKTYDGTTNATIRAEVDVGDLAFGDTFTIPDLTGTFDDANAGNNKKVSRTGTLPTVSGAENYDIAYPLITTASIFKADKTPPTLVKNEWTYDGTTKALVSSGGTGNTRYSNARDGEYSVTVPTGTDAGTYTVWYKELGDANHNDSAPQGLQVTISRKPLTANTTNITLTDHDLQTESDGSYYYVYDGTEKRPTVTIKDGAAELPDSEYAVKYSGNRNVGTATVTIASNAGGNYDVSGSIDFEIKAATASVIDAPQPKDLTYNGSAQELVTPGTAANGRVVYSLDNITYSTAIPTGDDAKDYTVWYKVQGDNGASDTSPVSVSVTIKPQTVNDPTILLADQLVYSAPYTGTPVEPAVTLIVNGQLFTGSYTVTYSNNTNVGTATVLVQSTGGNYHFYAVTTFQIVKAKAEFQTPPQAKRLVYTGKAQELVQAGTATGIVLYSLDAFNYTALIPTGIDAGSYTVYAKVQGSSQYEESDVVAIAAEIGKHEVNAPKVTLSSDSFSYNGSEQRPAVTVSDDSGNVIPAGEYEVTCTGDTTNPGTYTLTVTSKGINYSFAPVQREITILAAGVARAPKKIDGLVYNGSAQALVSGGTAESGALVYSLDNSSYSADIPTGTTAGPYRVWYKADSASDTDAAPAPIEVEIAKATPVITADPTTSTITSGQPLSASTLTGGTATFNGANVDGTFAWADGTLTPEEGTSQQAVTFTPADGTNYNTVTFQVTVTVDPASGAGGGTSGGSGGTDSTQMQTTVRNGTANTVLSTAAGSRLVRQAAADQSQNIVIKPEITGDVTKSQVSIPASTVSQIQRETDAALTVSAPIADVTIPNGALDTLGRAGGTVDVVTEQVDQSVVLTLTAGGEKVDSVPGGLTLSVPAEDAGPGTVAVLVNDDGTRETVRKSVVEDGKVNIPLDGSATVEIVDNSKDFDDVPPENWASDAVAFASARELFNGTSETTFSPDQPMSRGMLATVLYSLEGQPDLDLTGAFNDVSSDAWYADSVAWAAERGITSGYGNGEFGPDDSITREQLAVMLWKYAGSPAASDQVLNFTDADQASGYAREALCWAVENGILNGYADGQLAPGETATRAQAAQMLKNFMENT